MFQVLNFSSVRYLKNGRGGCWWPAAKDRNQAHFGWGQVQGDLLTRADIGAIEVIIRAGMEDQGAATRDLSQLSEVLDSPERHIWITFEDGFMWWCTLRKGAIVNPEGESEGLGHFWLTCDRPWSNRSVGDRLLSMTDLSGRVTSTAGFKGTICTPKAEAEVLRILSDQKDEDAVAVAHARDHYEEAIQTAVRKLTPQDFEELVDHVLVRSGWTRTSKRGGAQEGIDLEVRNAAADEVAFVQIKSTASQVVLDDYIRRFQDRRELYTRMFFAVHTASATLSPPSGLPVQVWTGRRIAQLAVRLGLGEWIERKLS